MEGNLVLKQMGNCMRYRRQGMVGILNMGDLYMSWGADGEHTLGVCWVQVRFLRKGRKGQLKQQSQRLKPRFFE